MEIYSFQKIRKLGVIVTFVTMIVHVLHADGFEKSVREREPVDNRIVSLFEHVLEENNIHLRTDVQELSSIVRWSKEHGRIFQCIAWLDHKINQNPHSLYLRMALADSLLISEDWQRLDLELDMQHWFYQEHIRLAYKSFVSRKMGRIDWLNDWEKAVDNASVNGEKLRSLIVMVSTWEEWGEEIEAVLWPEIIENGVLKAWSLDLLNKVYAKTGDLDGWIRFTDYLLGIDPDNLDLVNNHVVYSIMKNEALLIDFNLIRTLKTGRSGKKEYQLTYALYLSAIGEIENARLELEALPLTFIESPEHALYSSRIIADYDEPRSKALRDIGESGTYTGFEKDYLLQY